MADVLVLTGGELDQQTDPASWLTLSAGEMFMSSSSTYAMSLVSGERDSIAAPSASLDCCDARICPAGGDPGCNTLTGCDNSGEYHRVEWDHTGCSDASQHIAIHRAVDGGSFTEVADNISCDNANPDAGCCECLIGCCTGDGQFLFNLAKTNATSQTTDYQYRVRIELDGTDTLVSECTDSNCADCGGDDDCLA